MKVLNLVSAILILCMATIPVMAQETEAALVETDGKAYTHVPVSVSFVPNVSIGGIMGGDVITNFSLNIIAGRYAILRGIEFGSVLNWETEEVSGAQFSGVVNLLEHGDLTGLQAAGVVNYVSRDVITGGQIAPINYAGRGVKGGQIGNINYVGNGINGLQIGNINYLGDSLYGLQIGNINYLGDNINGLQIGNVNYLGSSIHGTQIGNVNYIGDNFQGVQIGNVNYVNYMDSRSNTGAQIGVVNVGGEIEGAQIGVVNVARKVRGTQIGVLNYADEMSGAPIGIFSFVRKGEIHLDAWASDTAVANIALKTGAKHAYSILTVGYQPPIDDDPYRWHTGVGIGAHIPYGSKFINIEALSFHINEDEGWENDLHMINKLRLIGGWEVYPNMSIFAGLTLNVFVSQVNNGDHIAWESFVDYNGDDTWVRMWPGFIAGVEF